MTLVTKALIKKLAADLEELKACDKVAFFALGLSGGEERVRAYALHGVNLYESMGMLESFKKEVCDEADNELILKLFDEAVDKLSKDGGKGR